MSAVIKRKNSSANTDFVENAPDSRTKSFVAASIIERAYLSYRDRQMFTLLKHAIQAAECSWTHDVLRKISPNEAALLADPSIKAKIRFRFAGREFPPVILFKIYLINNGTNYISGKKTIRPATYAAADACRQMGYRKFYDQMIIDACQFEKDKITDLVDVTTVKDYMQYLSNLDEMPCYLGGKENYWRHLSLENLPRQNIMYDIVHYLKTRSPSARLQAEMPLLLSRPVTQEVQLEQFRAISKLQPTPTSVFPVRKPSSRQHIMTAPLTQRRSSQSKRRVARMRRVYTVEEKEDNQDPTARPISSHSHMGTKRDPTSHPGESTPELGQFLLPSARDAEKISDADPAEEEARELYEWTRDLDYDDINRGMFPSASTQSVSFSSLLTKGVFAS